MSGKGSGRMKQWAEDGPPRYVDLEVTAHCNARCVMCPRSALTRPVGRMDGPTFSAVLAWCRRLRPKAVILSGFGEPLLHPEVLAMAGEIKRALGATVQINTNGSLLDEAAVRAIVDASVDIVNVSVNGTSGPEYERIMAGLRYRNMLDGMDRLMAAARPSGRPLVTVQATILRGVETNKLIRQWRRRGVDGVNLYPLNNRAGELDGTGLYNREAPDGAIPLEDRFCYSMVFIAWDGAVYPCSHDVKGEVRLGSILDSDPEGALQPETLRKEDYTICSDCDISCSGSFRRIGFGRRGRLRRRGGRA